MVGQIAVGIDEVENQVVLVVEELMEQPTMEEELAAVVDEEDLKGSTLRVHLSVDQAAAFLETSDNLMEGGRPPCRLCGQPLDPAGHPCPRLN